MTWLWVGIGIAIAAGLANPIASRFQSTGLWAGKALAPTDWAESAPRGLQDALTDGWPSWLGVLAGIAPLVAALVTIAWHWWGVVLPFVVFGTVSVMANRSRAFPSTVDWYLLALLNHAKRREADYARGNDLLRADAARSLAASLDGLFQIYVGAGIPAPTMEVAQSAPHGVESHLLDLAVAE